MLNAPVGDNIVPIYAVMRGGVECIVMKKIHFPYTDITGVNSKLQTTLLGDPNAKKSMLQLVDNVKNGAFKEALHNLHGVIDPVSASKADEVREVEKVQHIEKVKSQSCCGTCSTQNEVGSKFCRECGETLAKAA